LMFGGSGNASTGANWDGPPLLTGEYTHEVMGKTWGLFGHEGFFLLGNGYDIGIMTLFLFQMVFMDTAATIPTGAMAERWKFLAFCIYGFFISMLIYPIYGNWVWGGGWLSQLGVNTELGHGHVDFAGSSVVHMVGGVCALAGILVLGPRLGKYNKDGTVNALPAHNVPMYVVGTLILAFGWFGFNPGSALQMGNDLIAARCAVNTMLASGAGAFTGMLVTWVLFKKPDPSFMCNGMLAGLVAITAPCAFVAPWAAVVIGLSAGTLVVLSCLFFERVVKVDDPVGAVSVHGVCGAFGILSIAIFADGTYGKGWNNAHWVKDTATGALRYVADLPKDMSGLEEIGVTGLIYGNTGQLYASLIGIGTNFVWVFGVSLLVFLLIGLLIGNRVSEQVEREGLDIHEMGVAGYIEDDPKVPEGHLAKSGAEPRPATVPHNGENRFTLVVQGADQDALTKAWSALCQPGTAPSKDFLLVYPHMMTVTGNRFRFRGGDPDVIRSSMESLLQSHIKGAKLRAIVEN
jgi:ammonium transporter, Amt family